VKRTLPLLLVLSTAFAGSPACAEAPGEFRGECVNVHDGDTITVLRGRTQVKVRLEGIDCPELGQEFGTRAKQFTSSLLFGKTVVVIPYYRDRYGRTVARVRVRGEDVSLRLVEQGLAWHYVLRSSDRALSAAQRKAQEAHRGLWSLKSPIPPWKWRREKPSRHDRASD
jgi:micrococcal nuclease